MRNLKIMAGTAVLAIAGLTVVPGSASASPAALRAATLSTRYICIINTSQRCLDRPAQGSQLQTSPYLMGTSASSQGAKVYAEQNESFQCWAY